MGVYRIETSSGHVEMGRNVIGRIVAEAVDSFGGKVMLSNSKGRVLAQSKKVGGVDKTDYMEVFQGKDGLEIHINIVIRFGVSISSITGELIREIQNELVRHLGVEAAHISIMIAGILSKQLARRNILIHS